MQSPLSQPVHIRYLGQQEYLPTYHAMQKFTQERDENSIDEIWVVEHSSVFTLGRNGKKEHILDAGDIPVIPIDRGGQVTYHGIGQLVVYLLLDIRRKNIGVRELVTRIENSIIDYLASQQIKAESRRDAPGVYVAEKKVAALGLRVSKGRCYHGLSLNINMDLSPFQRINPCGYKGLEVTQCRDLDITGDIVTIAESLLNQHLLRHLEYDDHHRP